MKRSNLIFIALVATLYCIPVLLYGLACIIPGEKLLTGFSDRYEVIQIDNPDLKPENVKIDIRPASEFPRGELLESADRSYLYYNGTEQYIPEVSRQDSLLIIGGPKNAGQDKELTLHIRINNIQKVRLNGQDIWMK